MAKVFKKIFTDDQNVNRMQDQIVDIINPVASNLLLNGTHVKDISLSSSGDNIVNHKLGRNYVGWIITNKNANANVYESSTSNSLPGSHVILTTTANTTVDIWFF